MSSYVRWKIVATMMGQYDQVLREPGEVFELLDVGEDGSYPPQVQLLPKRDAQGRAVPDEFDEEILSGSDGRPLHRDFAPDRGEVLLQSGPLRGETMRAGWQRRVPDETPCGLYPPGTDFWNGELPPGEEPPRKTPARVKSSSAPIRGSRARPRHEGPPA